MPKQEAAWSSMPTGIVSRGPQRWVGAAPSGEATSEARLSGSVRTPASTGVKPRTFWRYSMTKVRPGSSPAPPRPLPRNALATFLVLAWVAWVTHTRRFPASN